MHGKNLLLGLGIIKKQHQHKDRVHLYTTFLTVKKIRREKSHNPVNSAYDLCKFSGQTSDDPLALNFDNRLAGTMMDKIIDFKVRKQALETAVAINAAKNIAP